jgi:hypothetical protein
MTERDLFIASYGCTPESMGIQFLEEMSDPKIGSITFGPEIGELHNLSLTNDEMIKNWVNQGLLLGLLYKSNLDGVKLLNLSHGKLQGIIEKKA